MSWIVAEGGTTSVVPMTGGCAAVRRKDDTGEVDGGERVDLNDLGSVVRCAMDARARSGDYEGESFVKWYERVRGFAPCRTDVHESCVYFWNPGQHRRWRIPEYPVKGNFSLDGNDNDWSIWRDRSPKGWEDMDRRTTLASGSCPERALWVYWYPDAHEAYYRYLRLCRRWNLLNEWEVDELFCCLESCGMVREICGEGFREVFRKDWVVWITDGSGRVSREHPCNPVCRRDMECVSGVTSGDGFSKMEARARIREECGNAAMAFSLGISAIQFLG